MSIWISDTTTLARRILALGLILPLAACMQPGDSGQGMGFVSQPESSVAPEGATPVETGPLKKADLFRGNVVVSAPEGYCIDRDSLKRDTSGGFALIASCANLGGASSASVAPAVITVTGLPRRLLAQPPSVAALSASAAPSPVIASESLDNLVVVQLGAGGDAALPQGDPKYWRGALLINGHHIGLAVYGPKGSNLSGDNGKSLLIRMAARLVSASSGDQRTSENQSGSE